jgi:hypothetical protein
MLLTHDHDRGIGEIHRLETRHQHAYPWPCGTEIEIDAEYIPLQQVEQRAAVQLVLAEKVENLRQHRLTDEKRWAELLHETNRPVVMGVAAI